MMSSSTRRESANSSASSSISLIKVDELSPFGATKQNRLPALISFVSEKEHDEQGSKLANSMPDFSASELEATRKQVPKRVVGAESQQQQTSSLPASIQMEPTAAAAATATAAADKENLDQQADRAEVSNIESEFQMVDMEQPNSADLLLGPSLPAQEAREKSIRATLESNLQQQGQLSSYSHLGDSLIEMIINLKNENQNLVRALETNNDYVKNRLEEFKRLQEEAKRRETQFASEKSEFEHQVRKLQRQNTALSERLKGMESKLKDMRLEVAESLDAAAASTSSSCAGDVPMYPQLALDQESFSNEALQGPAKATGSAEPTTMQIDANNSELYNDGDQLDSLSSSASSGASSRSASPVPSAPPSEQEPMSASAQKVANMTKEELSKHFDAEKAAFYALDDPMKQCDKLEQQLNEIGKRDYEICLLQQQLNIYRQDYRLERMANLEAKIQIERLKNDIDKLCLERLQRRSKEAATSRHHKYSGGESAAQLVGKLGQHLSRRAVRSAAKAAKYAAKQARREEKVAAAMARVSAYAAHTSAKQPQAPADRPQAQPTSAEQPAAANAVGPDSEHHRHRHSRHHRHHHHQHRGRGIGSEVVNDLLSTANKAMLTGYKMASTHVNLALDKLSEYEQQQASKLTENKGKSGDQQAPGVTTQRPSQLTGYGAPQPSID